MKKDQRQQDRSVEQSQPAQSVFTFSRPAFLEGIQQGETLFRQEHGQATFLTDFIVLKFYQENLSPFARDPIKHTGLLVG